MTQQTTRFLIIALLMFSGIFHLALALLASAPGLGWTLTASGIVYIGLSFYVRRDVHKKAKKQTNGRTAVILTICAAAAALGISAAQYLAIGGPPALPMMFLIDIAIIAAGAAWLLKLRTKA